MTEQKKTIDIAKLDEELTGAIEGMEAGKTDFLAKLSDDLLDDVSGGMAPIHYSTHTNVSVT